MAATRAQQMEIERQRAEQGERFIKQLNDMFQTQRTDMSQQYIPRAEQEARFEHIDSVVEGMAKAVEKLAGNVGTFHESAPRVFADRADTKQEMAELRTEIEKLKMARETDMQREYGGRIIDLQGRYKGDAAVERGWRSNAQQQSQLSIGQIITVGLVLFTGAVTIILTLALRKP